MTGAPVFRRSARDGLQLECITCALCIDACDGVMDKIGREKGLIGYSTLSDYTHNMALATADNFLKAGQFKRALVVGAETFSRILDWQDRTTCVLFGDGAGAVVLEAEAQSGTREDRGILGTRLHSDGRYEELLYVDGGPGSTRSTGHLRMNGREVFRHAVTKISGVIEETLRDPVVGRFVDSFPVPAGRRCRPDEIAALVAFLLGPDARFFVGSVVFADGGSDALLRPDDWPHRCAGPEACEERRGPEVVGRVVGCSGGAPGPAPTMPRHRRARRAARRDRARPAAQEPWA